jgi:ribosomal protein S27AE
VTFRYKDYRRNGRARYRTMTLAPDEFIRRFLLHVLPKGFHRIRHYGLLATAACKANVARARELIAAPLRSMEMPAEHDDAGTTGAVAEHRPPCPRCGDRMFAAKMASHLARVALELAASPSSKRISTVAVCRI